MASLFASQRSLCNQFTNCRDTKSAIHITQRSPAAAAATCCCPRDSSRRTAPGSVGNVVQTAAVRGQLQVVQGASKSSLYTQLPDRLDEPTQGFDSIAAALEDLAAGANAD